MDISNLMNKSCIDITEFMQKMQQVLIANYSELNLFFTAAYPQVTDNENLRMPIITYKYKKEPGEMGNRTENGPRLRTSIDIHKNNIPIDGDFIDVYAQMYDYWITFDIYGQNGLVADATADVFENFIIKFEPYFKSLGISYIKFVRRDYKDEVLYKTNMACRSLSYRIRLESITHTTIRKIKSIDIETDTNEPIQTKVDMTYEQKLDERLRKLLSSLK